MRQPDFTYLTDVYFGYGALEVLPELLQKCGCSRPLVVTDAGLVKLGFVERLGIGRPAVFDGVETNPTEACAQAGLARFRAEQCDGIVALGGGSPIDLAKILGLLVHHEGPLASYAIIHGGIPRITSRMPPLIAVPTTAGSGSEVGRAALLTLTSGGKVGFLSTHLLPKAAVCDPLLTLGTPAPLTAGCGMDALAHCVETYCSTKFNPVADAIALDGLERGFANLVRAVEQPTDRDSHKEMLLCSLQGGLAFQKSLGAVHSLSHPLGGLTEKRLHHGMLNALFLPHVLRFNYDSCAEKMNVLARRIGAGSGKELPAVFTSLTEHLGLPLRLRDLGLTPAELAPLAQQALNDHCSATNPCPLDLAACQALYLAAW